MNLMNSNNEITKIFKIVINLILFQLETLNSDYEKLQKSHNKLQKLCENLEDEKMYLQDELGRVLKEAELR